MPIAAQVAEAANASPPESNCHRSVVHWLTKGNAISAGDQAMLGDTKASAWGSVLASPTDPAFTKATLGNAPAGTVLGFFDEGGMLQHSMLAMGGGVIAGVNNLHVLTPETAEKVGIKYARVTVDQLKWVDASRVGTNQCVVRGAAPDVVAKRIKG